MNNDSQSSGPAPENTTSTHVDISTDMSSGLPGPISSEPLSQTNNSLKKYVNNKIISTVFGVFLLIGGIAAGLALVYQPQLFNQSAQVLTSYPPTSTGGLPCANGTIKSGTYFCYGSMTCLQCVNGRNQFADRKFCPAPCYYVTPTNLTYGCYHSQVDPDYGGTNVGGCAFSRNGCGQSVMSMILCDKKSSSLNPLQVSTNYYPDISTCTGTPPYRHTTLLNQLGIPYTVISDTITVDGIKSELKSGKKVMFLCYIDGADHWTYARGLDSSGNVVLSDPKYGDGNILGKTEKIDMSTCKSMISI